MQFNTRKDSKASRSTIRKRRCKCCTVPKCYFFVCDEPARHTVVLEYSGYTVACAESSHHLRQKKSPNFLRASKLFTNSEMTRLDRLERTAISNSNPNVWSSFPLFGIQSSPNKKWAIASHFFRFFRKKTSRFASSVATKAKAIAAVAAIAPHWTYKSNFTADTERRLHRKPLSYLSINRW